MFRNFVILSTIFLYFSDFTFGQVISSLLQTAKVALEAVQESITLNMKTQRNLNTILDESSKVVIQKLKHRHKKRRKDDNNDDDDDDDYGDYDDVQVRKGKKNKKGQKS